MQTETFGSLQKATNKPIKLIRNAVAKNKGATNCASTAHGLWER